jgi:mono/diheme cytochrome c family protein
MRQVIRVETMMEATSNENADTSSGKPRRPNATAGLYRRVPERGLAVVKRALVATGLALGALVGLTMLVNPASAVGPETAEVKRGRYLVGLGGCNDCHTPGYFFGKPDTDRFLGGSEVGFEIPGLGVFHGPNLTPDKETGLGKWSSQEIAKAITKGERPDGRMLAPIMPWHAFASLTQQDVNAIVAFLKSLPAVQNKVPGPFGPSEKASSFVMKIVAPELAAKGGPAPK